MKRPVSERTEPDRSWRGAFGASSGASPPPGEASSAPTGPSSPDRKDPSYEAINDAYRVVDEYLRQGQKMAEQFWLPAISSDGPVNQFGPLFERFMRSAGDMGTAWFEMMSRWNAPPGDVEGARGIAGPFGAGKTTRQSDRDARATPPRDRPVTSAGVSVQVVSTRKFEISVDLLDAGEQGDLELHQLVASDRALSPIMDVKVERDASGRRIVVRIHVPEAQPSGTYNGMLLERGTHRPRGTVSLSLA